VVKVVRAGEGDPLEFEVIVRHPDRDYGGMFLDWASSDDAPAYGSWGNGALCAWQSLAGWY
jgi:hypothetical protein